MEITAFARASSTRSVRALASTEGDAISGAKSGLGYRHSRAEGAFWAAVRVPAFDPDKFGRYGLGLALKPSQPGRAGCRRGMG